MHNETAKVLSTVGFLGKKLLHFLIKHCMRDCHRCSYWLSGDICDLKSNVIPISSIIYPISTLLSLAEYWRLLLVCMSLTYEQVARFSSLPVGSGKPFSYSQVAKFSGLPGPVLENPMS